MQIDNFKFGCFTIDGTDYQHDIKIIENKIKIWNYVKHHTVVPEDLSDILLTKPETIIIGTGTSGLVFVENKTKKLAEEKKINLLIKKTPEACKQFNSLTQQYKKVAAILHVTC